MSTIFLTSEDMKNRSIKDKAVLNYYWIRQNKHLLDEELLKHWDGINRLKEWNLHTAISWLHDVRYGLDTLYRLNCMEEAINKKISSIEANKQLEASTQRVQQEETTIARDQYQNSDIWVSDRHFR